MNNNYRVLHIFSGFGGGISSLILNLIENKTEDFLFDTLAFSYRGGETFIERVEAMGGHCFTMPRPRLEGYRKIKQYLDELLNMNHYDAIHCHISGWMALPFEHAAKKHGIKIVILHAHTTKYDSKLDRLYWIHKYDQMVNYKNATDYMTCSDMAADYIYGRKYLDKRKALLIPNGVKKELFSQKITIAEIESYNKEFNVPDDSKVILHVGRFDEQKNHTFLLDIVSESAKDDMNYIFLLVGDGELQKRIKEKADELNISQRIRFLNRRADVSKLMQYANAMILPSLYEGLPTVAVECQASGTPILIADTITKQCDMKMGLVRFLPISDAYLWKSELSDIVLTRNDLQYSIDKVEENGFTAMAAGKMYCDYLKKRMAIYHN